MATETYERTVLGCSFLSKYSEELHKLINMVDQKLNIARFCSFKLNQLNCTLNFLTLYMSDGEIIHEENTGELADLFLGIGKKIHVKVAGLLFFVLILLNTNVIIDRVFSTFSGAVLAGNLTSKGTVIMSMLAVLAYIILDVLASSDYI